MDEWTEQAVCVHTHVRAHTQDSNLKKEGNLAIGENVDGP